MAAALMTFSDRASALIGINSLACAAGGSASLRRPSAMASRSAAERWVGRYPNGTGGLGLGTFMAPNATSTWNVGSAGVGHNLSVANGSFAAVEICAFNVDTLAG